jgi:hypothetical protein
MTSTPCTFIGFECRRLVGTVQEKFVKTSQIFHDHLVWEDTVGLKNIRPLQ